MNFCHAAICRRNFSFAISERPKPDLPFPRSIASRDDGKSRERALMLTADANGF